MPAEKASGSGTRSKPTTRSSLRHSLNFASMGKALVDVINKEPRDAEKAGKKAKESSSRRSSAINLQPPPTAPRASLGDSKPPMFLTKKDDTTITRRRMSSVAQKALADDPLKSPESDTPQAGVKRSSSLRPRTGGSTALPKYRPKSAILESGTKIPSPPRSIRKGPDSSDEDGQREVKQDSRVSPRPHKSALKANLTNAIRLSPSPSTPPVDSRPLTPKSTKSAKSTTSSPSRPTKSSKPLSCSIPRPPSASSTSSSFTPRTPKTPSSVKHVSGSRLVNKELTVLSDSSHRSSPFSVASESPLARHSRHNSLSNTPTKLRPTHDAANLSHITEIDSDDSCDADDVELLLAPVSSLTAPTPAMPRLQSRRRRIEPETPTRVSPTTQLPTRANLSYLSPLPPIGDSPPSLRPPKQGSAKAARGSILSWDELAEEASRTLDPGEIDSMLSDVPAPFAAGAISPIPSTSCLPDIPESPCLNVMHSPSAYGSISQVLLPDVTPSPAVHYYNTPPRDMAGAADASLVTMLRLQLAAAENTAQERLAQLQAMEKEVHGLKTARRRDEAELTQQVTFLENNVRETLEARDRGEAERQAYISSLEQRVQSADAVHTEAVNNAVAKASRSLRKSHEAALGVEARKWITACSAHDASSKWMTVRDEAANLLDLIQQDQEVLAILKADLDDMEGMLDGPHSSPSSTIFP